MPPNSARPDKERNIKKNAPRKGRGERGGYDLLKGRLISWVNPRFFFTGTALDSKVKVWACFLELYRIPRWHSARPYTVLGLMPAGCERRYRELL